MVQPERRTRRSSRREAMLGAALELFAAQRPGLVTVGDIAERAGVTPAAVYYHFPSKDHILRECVRTASETLIETLSETTAELEAGAGMHDLVHALLRWLDDNEERALVLLVASVGFSVEVETVRQETRNLMLGVLTELVHRLRPASSTAEAAVCAAGLVSLVETSGRSWVERDELYRDLGRRDFESELVALADRLVGIAG
jgi:AcrR family transcriptional regulator